MTKLPYKTFTDVLADLERYESTVPLADAFKEWLTGLQRTPDDVHGFSLGAKNSMDIHKFDLEVWRREMYYPTYDIAVTFKDKSIEKTRFTLRANRANLWMDLLRSVKI
jgi:hypothetical protein